VDLFDITGRRWTSGHGVRDPYRIQYVVHTLLCTKCVVVLTSEIGEAQIEKYGRRLKRMFESKGS
jgi:hypothetical protein